MERTKKFMLKIESIDKKIQKKLEMEIPNEIIKLRKGSGNEQLQYVSGRSVTDILNHAFNYNWSWEVKKIWKEPSEPYYAKDDRKHENGLPQNPVVHCLGTLTVKFKDENGNIFEIKKDGFGAKTVVGWQSDQEDNYKAAATDALKKAATLFGVASQLYRNENEQFFFDVLNDPWNDEEVYKAHESEREFLKNYMKDKNFSADDLNKEVSYWSRNKYSEIQELSPEELSELVKFLSEEESK